MGGRAAWRGGLAREVLVGHIAAGLSISQMAAELDVSAGTVRHWLRRYDLQTPRAARLAATRAARERGDTMARAFCPVHGDEVLVTRPDGGFRCLRCRSDAVVACRRRIKATLIADAGGACACCGYDRCVSALHFHHVDRGEKSFAIASGGMSRSLARARAEVAKCVLLCANCHAEVEAGVREVPSRQARATCDGGPPDPG